MRETFKKFATNGFLSTDHGNSYVDIETIEVFFSFHGKARAHSCPDFPLEDAATVALVDRDMLTRVWNEMDYRTDVCRITKGGHIEYL